MTILNFHVENISCRKYFVAKIFRAFNFRMAAAHTKIFLTTKISQFTVQYFSLKDGFLSFSVKFPQLKLPFSISLLVTSMHMVEGKVGDVVVQIFMIHYFITFLFCVCVTGTQEASASIALPVSLVKDVVEQAGMHANLSTLRLTSLVFADDRAFQSREEYKVKEGAANFTLGGRLVLSASVSGHRVEQLTQPVVVQFEKSYVSVIKLIQWVNCYILYVIFLASMFL